MTPELRELLAEAFDAGHHAGAREWGWDTAFERFLAEFEEQIWAAESSYDCPCGMDR